MNKDYPCQCEEMKWMIDNNKVFKKDDGSWMLTWMELDRNDKKTNIENFGVRFKHCLFCGKKINN